MTDVAMCPTVINGRWILELPELRIVHSASLTLKKRRRTL